MSNRQLHNLAKKYEAEDLRRLDRAAQRIQEDPDLRFLISAALEGCGGLENSGMAANPHTTNALTTAHETGKMAAMQYFIGLIANHAPSFYPDLLKEILHERTERTASYAAAEQPDPHD